MARIDTIRNTQNTEDIYPVTRTDAVYDEDGNRLDNVIADMKSFSTEERIVGKWINGKTLYEKTIETTSHATAMSAKFVPIGETVDFGYIYMQTLFHSNGNYLSDNFYQDSNNQMAFALKSNFATSNQNTLSLVTSYTNRPVTITVRYTKATE